MCLSSSPGWTVYVPPFWGVALAWAVGVGGTGVAVGLGVAVGGARVGGGAEFDATGRLPRPFQLDSGGSRLGGEARLVPGNCATARMITASGSSSARPRTKRSAPPPDALEPLERSGVRNPFDPCDACICHSRHFAVRVPGGECSRCIVPRSKLHN